MVETAVNNLRRFAPNLDALEAEITEPRMRRAKDVFPLPITPAQKPNPIPFSIAASAVVYRSMEKTMQEVYQQALEAAKKDMHEKCEAAENARQVYEDILKWQTSPKDNGGKTAEQYTKET